MYAPPPIRFSKKCKRCGLRYPRTEKRCVHCTGLSDTEVEALLIEKKKEHKTSAVIGRLFLYITVLIVILIALASI